MAKFVERAFIPQLKSNKYYKDQKYDEALVETFKRIDDIISSRDGEE